MGDYNRGFTSVVIGCALFNQQNSTVESSAITAGAHFKTITSALRKYYHLIAEIEGETLSGWRADPDHAGWLLHAKHPIFIRVPVHLAALFPTSGYLDDLFEVSNKVRTSTDSIICVSGSNSVKNILDIVDDIDFCEYLQFDKEITPGMILEKSKSNGDVICLQIKVNAEKYPAKPHFRDEIQIAVEKVDPRSANSSTVKLDYIVKVRDKRAYDASTIVVMCDRKFKSAGFTSTFAHQEVHISASDNVPIELDDVIELGRYVLWLLAQVKKYRDEGNVTKMLKRALSLTRVCWMTGYTEEIEKIFSKTTFLIERELKTISEIREKLEFHCKDEHWRITKDDLSFFEDVANLERQKLEVIQRRNFPAGPDDIAFGLANRIIEDCRNISRGALRI